VSSGLPHPPGLGDGLAYPFFQSVFDRKSRRMALGMTMPGTLEYASPYKPVPLTELEEALLLVAGTGLTGLNLGDIDPSMGADALVQWTARTWPSSCSNHGTELFFTNDDGTYFLDMWNLVPEEGELATLSGKSLEAQVEWILELVRRAKVPLAPERAQMPTGLPGLFVFNHWNANMPGTTLFLPVSNMTLEYINLLFIYFSSDYRFTLVDETNGYTPCGLERWIDAGRIDPARQMGIVELEQRVLSMQVVEQAFICQNINLALQAMGLGGWTYTGYIARYALGGMDVPGLGFRFEEAARGPSVPVGRDGGAAFGAIEAIRTTAPGLRILALECRTGAEQFSLALRAGADGFLTREAEPADVVAALHCIRRGETYVAPALVTKMVNTYVLRNPEHSLEDAYDSLSDREHEVLLLAAVGHTNREIAKVFHLSEQTVHNYRATVMEKLGFHDRVQLLRFAVKRGIVSVADL